jgi:hypothetical protein
MIGDIADQTYSGAAITPVLTVTDGEKTLTLDTDYTVEYTNNTNVGTATVTITGKGNYTGEASATFSIVNKTLAVDEVFTNDNTYATYFNVSEDILLPEGIVAYVVTAINGNTLTTQALSYIPQETAVLLERNENVVTTNDEIDTNLLMGTPEPTEVSDIEEGTVYVLYNDKFVKSTSGEIPAGRAYLVVLSDDGEAPESLSFDFNDATGIETIHSSVLMDNVYYDLNGRKLSGEPSKNGLYITNGKKVVVNHK